ncbi:MAG: NUDIX domain-containing protein [Pseudomonadota bacterium]|nr:NUDIX domain-containing protein [Pseudomonadota bacterium]MEC8977883.1 NUDIX domain-containing protein [Pseudomonadota bacterium]|tara:strand:+ start:94 stop:516 length:423 start_codon:yes stop_codon:yes gene_type:complete
MIRAVKYEKSCGIVVLNNNKILLLHYPSGHWDFPKGHVDGNETEQETAVRELVEETAIDDIHLVRGFRYTTTYHYRRNRHIYQKKVVYFLGTTSVESVTISHEHQGYCWLEWDLAKEKMTFDNSRVILNEAHDFWIKQEK